MKCQVEWKFSPELSRRYASRLGRETAPGGESPRRLSEELRLRGRPLREQWEARGPGLLAALARRMPWFAFPPSVPVALVKPLSGGGGTIIDDTLYFEAVLANPCPRLPEVLRLAWFLTRFVGGKLLDITPGDGENVPGQRLAAALIPPVLWAGEIVELATFDARSIQSALHLWLPGTQLADSSTRAERLLEWWNRCQTDKFQNAASWWRSATHAV